MDNSKYDTLRLENQLCFPLYAASREIIKNYKPFLDELDLTYTQYITLMLLWENKTMRVKEIGEMLYLDSGTLTPLLKKLECKGLITRARSIEDERNLNVTITALIFKPNGCLTFIYSIIPRNITTLFVIVYLKFKE